MNRLGIFVFYDKQGIVDRYVEYLLEGLKDYLSRLVIVCNGLITEMGRECLAKYSDEIYVRDNTGYDAMAYKLALTSYVGWDDVDEFDEILLFNDTFYGPIYPFSEMFEKMDREQCDFWGITCERKFNDYVFGSDSVTPTHVHTYFCVYRKSAVMNMAFKEYWNNFDSTEWFFSDVCRHEMTFTKVLEDEGLTWKTYVELPMYHSDDMLDASVNPYYSLAYDIIKEYRCPILKRKNFIIKNLSYRTGTCGEETRKALEYVAKETTYNEDYIWENIIRLYNIYEIKNALHLDYVLTWDENVYTYQHKNIKIFILVQDEKSKIQLMEYLEKPYSNKNVDVISSYEEWGSKLNVLDNEIKYVCFLKLDSFSTDEPMTIRKSRNYIFLENTIKSIGYTENIVKLFEENKRLGILTVPVPIHGNEFGQLHDLWGNEFEQVIRVSEKMGLQLNISCDIPCINKEMAMWCRLDAIRFHLQLFQKNNMSVNARIIPYIAQNEGYYTGTVMNVDYASLYINNLLYDVMGCVQKCYKECSFTDYKSFCETRIETVVRGYKNVMIYGAGANGIKVSNLFKRKKLDLKGFVVSDDQPKQAKKNGFPIYRLSDVPFKKEETLIIVSVAYSRSRNAIVKNLKMNGYKNYYLL